MNEQPGYVIEGRRAMALRVRATPRAGHVEIALLSHGNRVNEAVVLTAAEAESLAQALAMALFAGRRALQ